MSFEPYWSLSYANQEINHYADLTFSGYDREWKLGHRKDTAISIESQIVKLFQEVIEANQKSESSLELKTDYSLQEQPVFIKLFKQALGIEAKFTENENDDYPSFQLYLSWTSGKNFDSIHAKLSQWEAKRKAQGIW